MRVARIAALSLLLGAASPSAFSQTPASSPLAGPTFDVVSIKPHPAGDMSSSMRQAPAGGFAGVNLTARTLILQAYPTVTGEVVGLPDWVSDLRYDIAATASLARNPTADIWSWRAATGGSVRA